MCRISFAKALLPGITAINGLIKTNETWLLCCLLNAVINSDK
jgi:hypothetical protein